MSKKEQMTYQSVAQLREQAILPLIIHLAQGVSGSTGKKIKLITPP